MFVLSYVFREKVVPAVDILQNNERENNTAEI